MCVWCLSLSLAKKNTRLTSGGWIWFRGEDWVYHVFFAWHASNRMPFLDISGRFPCHRSQAAFLAEASAARFTALGLPHSSNYPFSMIVGYLPIVNHHYTAWNWPFLTIFWGHHGWFEPPIHHGTIKICQTQPQKTGISGGENCSGAPGKATSKGVPRCFKRGIQRAIDGIRLGIFMGIIYYDVYHGKSWIIRVRIEIVTVDAW